MNPATWEIHLGLHPALQLKLSVSSDGNVFLFLSLSITLEGEKIQKGLLKIYFKLIKMTSIY